MNQASQPVSNKITGGVFFSAVIQGRDITVTLPPQVTPALSGLPRAAATFTGRDDQVELLLKGLAPDEPTAAVLVCAVAGLAGVGKTELVVQAATQALRQPGWFPGGTLFVDMFGYDPQRRLSPGEALLGLLQALGMPGDHIPASEQDRSRLFRSVLAAYAAQDRRLLLVIDNASTAAQVTPLLPGDDSTAVLITSRHTLAVGASLCDLDVLNVEASVQLIANELEQARGRADTRVRDEPQAATEIARLCAGLPLALRIAAALLADNGTRALASLAEALSAARTRLDRLHREDSAVRAAFDLSYQQLSSAQARLFRLLPVNPGPDIGTDAAACLADTDPHEAEALLQDLARAHLIDPGHAWGRWRMHDLVRLYADDQPHTHAKAGELEAARARLLTYYLATARAASAHPQPPPVTVSPRFPTRADALAWLRAERENLLACIDYADRTGGHADALRLMETIAPLLLNDGPWDVAVEVQTRARDLAEQVDDRKGQANALANLGQLQWMGARLAEGQTTLNVALDLYKQVDDRKGQANALMELGHLAQHAEAEANFTEALDLYKQVDDLYGQARALRALGLRRLETGRHTEAEADYTEALDLYKQVDDLYGQVRALVNRGQARLKIARHTEAEADYTEALDLLSHRCGSRDGGQTDGWQDVVFALTELGRLRQMAGDHAGADAFFREARQVREQAGRSLGV